MQKKNIAIIGAGIAGLTAGALLCKKGHKITIFERQPTIGGRALAFDGSGLTLDKYKKLLSLNNCHISSSFPGINIIFQKNMLNNYKIDLGYHAIGGGVLSNLNEVLAEFNESIHFLESYVGFIYPDHYDFPFLSRIDKIKILPNILRLLFASEQTLKRLDSISITETIKRYGKGKMKNILEIFSRTITTVNNLDRISTGEMFRAQRNLYRGSKPVGYPIGGLEVIHRKLAEIINSQGGTIELTTPVDEILIEKNNAFGIQSHNQRYTFDTIIYSGFPQHLFTIADAANFPDHYVDMMNSLTGTGSLCAYYSLNEIDENLIGKTFHFIERNCGVDGNDAVGMIDFMCTSPDSNIAPKGKYLVQSYIICTPEEAMNPTITQKLTTILDTYLSYLLPDFQKSLNWAIYPAVFHLDGVAKTIDNQKPQIQTPINNLFIIGDGVKAMGIGFNCALNSAKKLAETFF
jgi:protoporphyrinogen oxidase